MSITIPDFVGRVLRPVIPDNLLDPDPVAWIERHFYIPETNAPIVLEPYQRAVVKEALRRDEDGLFVYSLVLYSDLKKSAKSTIAAAVCLYMAWHNAWTTVRIVANDLKQADSRTFYYIERAILLNPELRNICRVVRYEITLPNKTTITAIAVDPKGEAGGGDIVTCYTELWAYKNEASKRLWTETTLSPLLFGKSLRWCESYAGFEGDSPILEPLYQNGVKEGRLVDVGIDGLELYANDPARMLTLWNTIPRCPWQTPEYYAQESGVLTEGEFARVHKNEWGQTSESFVDYAWWQRCEVATIPPLTKNEPLIIAADAGVSSDCFAVVGVDRIQGMETRDRVRVRLAKGWMPPKGGKLIYENPEDKNDIAYPSGYIRWLVREYNVYELAYDEYQLHHLMMSIGADESVKVRAFPQGADRAIADKRLYEMIKNREIEHGGIPVLNDHIKNANRKPEDEKYLRIIKRSPQLKIDAAVAASMANHRSFAYAW